MTGPTPDRRLGVGAVRDGDVLGFEGFSDRRSSRFLQPGSLFVRVALVLALVAIFAFDLATPVYIGPTPFYLAWILLAVWLGEPGRIATIGAALLAATCRIYGEVADFSLTVGQCVDVSFAVVPLDIAVAWSIRQLIYKNRRITELSRRDPLTGLANRRHFDDLVGVELRRAWRYHRSCCVAVIDVNKFKVYNDTHGHTAGDQMLRDIAASLRAGVRDTDTVARIGGDEFAILFPETTLADAQIALDHVAREVAEHYPAGVAAGVNFLDPTLDAVLEGGDRAMYTAKFTQAEDG